MIKSGNAQPNVLICDDDDLFHLAVQQTLKGKVNTATAKNGDEALAILKNRTFDIVLLDIKMRTEREGIDFISKFKDEDPDLMIVMSSGLTDFDTVREAMRLGATDYVPKDFHPNELLHTIQSVLEKRNLLIRKNQQNAEVRALADRHLMVGSSPAIKKLRVMIEKAKRVQSNIVITGESGTGKEIVARQLRGTLADGSLEPFVAVDSATIQSETAESLLFGHEKGAFTGADKTKKGLFEEADGGIIYFDEIVNMPLGIQAKLLRVLQEKEVSRMGSSKVIPLSFRVICATNQDLEKLCEEGRFKHDLYQRLNVIPIQVAPLRDHSEDIPALIERFIELHTGRKDTQLDFTPEAIQILSNYTWPGNVRELSNLVAYLIAMTDSNQVDVEDLPEKIAKGKVLSPKKTNPIRVTDDANFYTRVAEFEKQILASDYSLHDGNVSKMASSLEMDRSHLYSKLKQYGIHAPKAKTT